MKTKILSVLAAILLPGQLFSQTADSWIAAGRYYLTTHDLASANNSFAGALTASPTNATANAFYAVTRLLMLPNQPAGSNFLTRLGFPAGGRDIYNWTSKPPVDSNGVPVVPAGVNANEFTGQLRTNLLPEIAGAIANLAAVTATNFTLSLSSSETAMTAVTVDYGDLKLIQAGLYGMEYLIFTLNAQNLNVQLSAIRDLYNSGTLSAGRVLQDYPQLLTWATTNDLQNARLAFTNAVNAYMVASDFIRARSTNEVRLFNYDPASAQSEADFRLTLRDLKNSLQLGPQSLSAAPDLQGNMTPQFDGTLVWRDALPKFDANAIELGSFPDLTFDGSIYGLRQDTVESFLGKHLTMLPVGHAPEVLSANTLGLTFNTLRGHYYVLEGSTNLVDWLIQTNFTASDITTTLLNPLRLGLHGEFYRLRDDSGFLAFSGVVLDQATSLPIAGAQVYSQWDGTSTVTDANGQFYLTTTLPTSTWGNSDYLQVSASGYAIFSSFYYGDGLISGLQIYLSH